MKSFEGETPFLALPARAALDAVPDACLVVYGDGTVAFANQTAQQDIPRLQIGCPLSFTLRVPAFLDAVDRVIHNGEAEDLTWAEKVPTERWYEAFIRPLEADCGAAPAVASDAPSVTRPLAPAAVAIFLRDLTEQKRIDRMRADFVANASHELRTPLASLTGFIETLRGPARDDAGARDTFLSIMQDQAVRMRRLIDDLLSLSRVEMRAHLRPKTVMDITSIVREAVSGLGPLAAEQDMRIEVAGCADPAPVLGDRGELLQVFVNLIANALRYGKPADGAGAPGLVTLTVQKDQRQSGTVAVTVRDLGPGIAPEHLPRLTERFYRIGDNRRERDRGTGLGLAIVKHILNRHQGRLTIESTVGHGAAFTVRLALVTTSSRHLNEEPEEAQFQRLTPS